MPSLASPAGTPEAGYAEIEKHDNDHCRGKKCPMIGALQTARSRSPQNRREHQHREQKKCAGNFEPDFAANMSKGFEESAEPPRNPTRGLSCDARLACNASSTGRACHTALLLWCAGARRGFAHDGLAGHAARNPQSHAQHPSDGLRFHFDMMVAAADIRKHLHLQSGDASCRIDA